MLTLAFGLKVIETCVVKFRPLIRLLSLVKMRFLVKCKNITESVIL